MVKLGVFLAVVIFYVSFAIAAECPSYTKVLTCTPKCWQDSECSAIGGKCCPNICNDRSCARPNELSKSDYKSSPFDSRYKDSGTSGKNCGNVKCSVFEKCVMDQYTKRMKCVRS